MSYPVNINLNSHVRGDVWVGIPNIGPVLVNSSTPSGALSRVRMQLRSGSVRVFRLDSDGSTNPDAPITISNSATWQASIPPVQSFVKQSGEWRWDMEFYEAGNTSPRTFYSGILEVIDDVTK